MFETEERDMIERVLRLADKPVRAIMTPRTELAWIDRTGPDEGHRGAESGARIGGSWCARARSTTWSAWCRRKIYWIGSLVAAACRFAALRQPIVVPDTVTALDALEQLKTDTLGVALVLDEYGSFEAW